MPDVMIIQMTRDEDMYTCRTTVYGMKLPVIRWYDTREHVANEAKYDTTTICHQQDSLRTWRYIPDNGGGSVSCFISDECAYAHNYTMVTVPSKYKHNTIVHRYIT